MKLEFHGADQNVTGSCHLLDVSGTKILIDCGLYQGGREMKEENAEPFGFDPASIDYLLLTHAHLDHCGRIPLLVKRGFTGEIISPCRAESGSPRRQTMWHHNLPSSNSWLRFGKNFSA